MWIVFIILFYFFILYGVGYLLSKNAGFGAYFNANKNFSWILITIGMIGDSLSGVTFISVPGKVYSDGFQYLQVVLGYVAGYWFIAGVLLPLYYKYQIISVYEWLGIRFDAFAQKSGSVIFIVSRLTGAAARLYLSVWVLHFFILKNIFPFEVPFLFTVFVFLSLIYLYTRKGGLKVLVYTDTFQSLVLFTALCGSVLILYFLLSPYHSLGNIDSLKILNSDFKDSHFFLKDFLGGMAICIAMTGLDQNMMQKNLSCRSLRDAVKNMLSFSLVVLVVNALFLLLGYYLKTYYVNLNIELPLKSSGGVDTDAIFPKWAMEKAPLAGIILFIFGLTAATFNSADSVLTTLTTSFYVDILEKKIEQEENVTLRNKIHLTFALLIFLFITFFYFLNDSAIIDTVLFLGGVTYGPLLGLFMFGIFTQRVIIKAGVMSSIIIGITLSLIIFYYLKSHANIYKPGVEFIVWNGFIHFVLFFSLSKTRQANN